MLRPHSIIVDGVRLDRRRSKTLTGQVYRAAFASHRAKLAYVFLAAAAPIVPIIIVVIIVVPLVPRSWAVTTGLIIGVTMAVLARPAAKYGFFYVYRHEIRMAMRRFGYSLCPDCGYWLKGIAESTGRCPECGTAVTPPTAHVANEDDDDHV